MSMEMPKSAESERDRLKRLIAENMRELETLSGQALIDAERAIEVYQADLKRLEERGE